MTKISIILPVLNSANYLSETINNIIKQKIDDIELICIDCNSSDNSLEILNRYTNNNFIKILSQKTENIGENLNFGVKKSKGKYIAFLNVKDKMLNENSLDKLYSVAEDNNATMVSGNIQQDTEKISSEKYFNLESLNNNLFKKEFIIENDISFPNLSKGFEAVFLAEILSKVDTIYTTPVDFYSSYNVQIMSKNDCDNYIKHFKIVFDYLSDPKFNEIKHEYRYNMLDCIDKVDNDNKKYILDAVRDIFKDEPRIVQNFEENFYFKTRDKQELNELISFEIDYDNPRISVLIPVYNAKDFLDDSISSLLNQTFSDFELICVNDGSKDNSIEILEKFAIQDSRVKVIDKENGGCGSARNRALKEAKGQYVYFFDPDDELSLETFEEVYENAIYNDSEIIIFKSDIIIDDKINRDRVFFDVKTKIPRKNYDRFTFNYSDNKEIVLSWDFAPWGKLYKKEFLDSYDDFRFDIGVAFDDVPFHAKSMLRAKRISFVDKFFYHYRMDNVNSVNNTSSNGYDIFEIMDILENLLKSEGLFEEFKMEFNKFIVAHSLFYIVSTNSEEYFKIAKGKFEMIKDEYAPPFKKYQLVMETEDYEEFKLKWFELEYNEKKESLLNDNKILLNQINSLKNKNRKLSAQNKKLKNDNDELKKLNENLLNSSSWKVTKPLRFIKNLK
jgi:glycosyltransferase involved in cell wall biosynthesis